MNIKYLLLMIFGWLLLFGGMGHALWFMMSELDYSIEHGLAILIVGFAVSLIGVAITLIAIKHLFQH